MGNLIKLSKLSQFVDTLERNELTEEQQAILLIGTSMADTTVAAANNCKCNGNNCDCNTRSYC